MISNIKVHKVASYENPVEIKKLSKFNFFYGLNGTGKTTLSNYLGSDVEDADYSECEIWPESIKKTHQIHVYNQKYIDRIFRSNPKQPGIFTLGEKDVKAEQRIEAAQAEKDKYEQKLEPLLGIIKDIEGLLDSSEIEIQDSIWENEQPRKIVGPLEFCVKGALHKETFFEKISDKTFSVEDEKIAIEDLEEEAIKLEEQDITEKPIFETLPLLKDLEDLEILSQKIIGKNDSYLSDLIDNLDNFSWVKKGIENYLERTDDCPFCQQRIEDDRKKDIKVIIDDTFTEKEEEIKSIYENYALKKKRIEELIKKYQINKGFGKREGVNADANLLKERLNTNLYRLEKKIEDISQPINLEPTSVLIEKINDYVLEQNIQNSSFNSRITNKRDYEDDISKRFWIRLHQKYEDQITQFERDKALQIKKLKDKKEEKKLLQEKIKEAEKVIRANRQKNSTVQKSIDYINTQLRYVGFEGFFIDKVDSKTYKLERPENESKNLFHSLSEGEKTIITFLYFIQQCLGAKEEDESPDLNKRIVVIDDPISSLSFPLVYDVAHLIKSKFLNSDSDFAQVFILTHHLYFYHELVERNEIDGEFKSYYRVTKNKQSQILPLKKDEIKNSYQSYWYTLKDIKAGNTTSFVLPNTMRNILEHYFSFVGGDKYSWKRAIEQVSIKSEENQSFNTLMRYLNRESHSDPINLTDTNEFDVDKFILSFKAIFEELGHIDHYKKMMREN